MGAYLPTPVREKESEDGETQRLRFGSSSMQGWRISQEDAHNCIPDFDTDAALFAVYDGHGGQEVAQYTAMKYPDFLKRFPKYKDGDISQALEETFLEFDASLTQEHVIKELTDIAGVAEDEDSDNDEQKECEELCEEADMPIEKLLERYGGPGNVPQSAALKAVKANKADFKSPVIKPKSDSPGLTDEQPSDSVDSTDPVKVKLDDQLVNGHSSSAKDSSVTETANNSSNEVSTSDIKTETKSTKKAADDESESLVGSSKDVSSNGSGDNEVQTSDAPSSSSSAKAGGSGDVGGPCVSSSEDVEACGSSSAGAGGSSSSSTVTPGGSAGGSGAGSSSGSGAGSSTNPEEPSSSTGRTRKRRKGVIPDDDEDESSFDEEEETTDEEEDSEASGEPWHESSDDDEDGAMQGEAEEEECEEIMTGGEEPGSDSGCTAVVAILRSRELLVANAGDSRCVLCRAGNAIDMSIDHKPEDQIELDRITKAGGRVTMDGRVNGGLNLSRAIGDHVYKTNTDLPLKDQMITALPDVKTIALDDTDEFMVLACDGIWNVMSSQNVVDFVRARLKGSQSLSSICEEMFEFCLAPDTTGDGSGCDNMTCVIVAFDRLFTHEPVDTGSSSSKRSVPEDEADVPEAKKQKL